MNMLTKKHETERITARVSNDKHVLLLQAANIVGATLNQFLVQSAIENAQKILENERVITLSARDTESFFTMLENPPPINDKLKSLLQNYKESDLYDEDRSS
jgi:uncharacterized protein (DUF1778 family)